MKTYLSLAAALTLAASLAGCNGDKKNDKKLETTQTSNGFALKADICGAFVSLADFADKDGNTRQASLEVAIGVCGKMENSEAGWSALGARLQTPTVYLHKDGAGFDGGDKYDVSIEGESKVYAVKGTNKTLLGTVAQVKRGMKVKLESGVVAELAVGNRAYQVTDGKSDKNGERRLFFAVP